MQRWRRRATVELLREALVFLWLSAIYWVRIYPQVRREIAEWKRLTTTISDPSLRRLASEKLTRERLNPEAAAFFAVLAPGWRRRSLVRLIVAYQILYDYLDAVTEQPDASDLQTGLRLHRALSDAVAVGQRFDWRRGLVAYGVEDGYLYSLVQTCRHALDSLPSRVVVQPMLTAAAWRCGAAQAHNHAISVADPRLLIDWSVEHGPSMNGYLWWELAAAGISCLVIHALFSQAATPHATATEASMVERAYYPSICAVSALLDSLADYSDDLVTLNHSFVSHYVDGGQMADRLATIFGDAANAIGSLKHRDRHRLLLGGITAFYTSTPLSKTRFGAAATQRLNELVGPVGVLMRATMRLRKCVGAARASGQ